jgi:hypothetical protein
MNVKYMGLLKISILVAAVIIVAALLINLVILTALTIPFVLAFVAFFMEEPNSLGCWFIY